MTVANGYSDKLTIDRIDVIGNYEGKELPEPFSKEIEKAEGDIVTLVDVDIAEYRRKEENRMVRKNCTIPYYLNEEAEKAGINFSRLLQDAIKEKLCC